MLTIDGKKMGKSLGNSSYLVDLFQRFDPMTLRFFLLQSHYRSTTEFKYDAIEAAGVGYEKLLGTFERLKQQTGDLEHRDLTSDERKHPVVSSFIESMNDDFNSPQAIASLYELSKETNEALANNASADALTSVYHIWSVLAQDILGIIPTESSASNSQNSDTALDSVLQMIIRWRAEARSAKDFKRSDEIRDTLNASGIALEDGKDGSTRWTLK
jgi:cysteinyl-tRNA synthetase